MGLLWLSGPLEKSLGSRILALGSSGGRHVNVLMTTVLITLAFPKQSVIQKLTDKLNSITRESLTGIRVVRAYNAEDYQDKKFEEANEEVTRLNLFVNRLMAIMNPIMMAISSGLSLAIYWIGAYIINDASLTERLPLFSDMVVFMSYAMQVVMGFLLMGALFIVLPRTLVSAGRINQVLDLHSSIEISIFISKVCFHRGVKRPWRQPQSLFTLPVSYFLEARNSSYCFCISFNTLS